MANDRQQPNKPDGNNELKQIEKTLEEINPKVFDGVPTKKRHEILRSLSVSIHKFRSGPLPDPEELRQYAELIPDGAERIMRMAENQQQHRMELERIVVRDQMRQSGRGQFFGLIIGIVAIVGGVICGLYGHEWTGSFIGGGGITGLVSVFVIGKRRQRKSLEDKN